MVSSAVHLKLHPMHRSLGNVGKHTRTTQETDWCSCNATGLRLGAYNWRDECPIHTRLSARGMSEYLFYYVHARKGRTRAVLQFLLKNNITSGQDMSTLWSVWIPFDFPRTDVTIAEDGTSQAEVTELLLWGCRLQTKLSIPHAAHLLPWVDTMEVSQHFGERAVKPKNAPFKSCSTIF